MERRQRKVILKQPNPPFFVSFCNDYISSDNGYWVFPGGKKRPEREAHPSPPSSAVVKKGWSYTSTPPMSRTACTEPQCLYKGALYLYLYLYISAEKRTKKLGLSCTFLLKNQGNLWA